MRYNEFAWKLPAICPPHLDGGISLSAFPDGTTRLVNLPTFSPHCPFNAERQAGKL